MEADKGAPISACAQSVVNALQFLRDTPQAKVTDMTVLAGDHGYSRAHELFSSVPIRVQFQLAPKGNSASYIAMLRLIKIERITFLLEEDYLVRADVFLRMAEFFKAYSPCIAAPYDYPDRYILRDAPSRDAYNRNIILKAPHLHWRTATSTTVTLAVRGIAASRLPTPMDDYKRSRALGALYGIFTPIPSLASHEHGEEAAASVIRTLT